MPDMSAEAVAKALVTHWISRFGVPHRITSDRGRQFESSVFAELMQTIGATHLRTTAYHPQANGLIERWHRTFKSAILCHDSSRWVYHLPTILLGLRVVFKPDINASPAELVYGTTLSIPGEFFFKNNSTTTTSDFVAEFRNSMKNIELTQTSLYKDNVYFQRPTVINARICSRRLNSTIAHSSLRWTVFSFKTFCKIFHITCAGSKNKYYY